MKLSAITTIVSIAYFGYLKYFTTHPADVVDFVILVLATMLFGAWMVVAMVTAGILTKREDKNTSEKSC